MYKLIAIMLVFSITAFGHFRKNEESSRSDSGIFGPEYAQIQQTMQNLVDLYPDKVELITLGQTVKGIDQQGIIISKNSGPKNLFVITGATHGNEYLNIVDRLMSELVKTEHSEYNDFLNNDGAYLVIPVLNPDGYDSRRRSNANGADLNRDFPIEPASHDGLVQPESRNLVSFLSDYTASTGAQVKLVVDYHCCNGSLLYPFAYTSTKIDDQDLNAHQRVGAMMETYFPGYAYGITGEILGYYPLGTTKDYWYLTYNALAFTFEGAWRKEKNKFSNHLNWWKELSSTFN